MVYGTENEKPTPPKVRIAIATVLWLLYVPVLIAAWFWIGWWVLILAGIGVWASVDYVRRGVGLGDVGWFGGPG